MLKKAFEFFSEFGLTAQTRALADACGISQRLLYSVFPNKSALISAVYETRIAGVFKAVWFVQLRDRSKSMEQRLNDFYRAYYDAVLTRSWMRLFLYASLAEVEMAPTYIASIIKHLLDTVMDEALVEAGLEMPSDRAEAQEICWFLHGAVSHLAIRRHIYRDQTAMETDKVISLQVRLFLGGLKSLLPARSTENPANLSRTHHGT
ncbi:MAG: TetR/AcrR family transcriptional regulator [Rhodoferax sp.]|nr:TetR/AcrR family transcriptional regulator [Rhodoferax sp.]MCF8209492.1 TetR/AcrR family transcriptional regulator [Rhodoferax sp.]